MTKTKKLSPEQIAELYQFVAQHFVPWQDVQHELVDHLANDIETIWEQEPDLIFEFAKEKAFAKFGIFGFEEVVKQKTEALRNKYYRMLFSEFKASLWSPMGVVFPVAVLTLFGVYSRLDNCRTLIGVFLAISFFSILKGWQQKIKTEDLQSKTGKKLLWEEVCSTNLMHRIIGISNLLFGLINLFKADVINQPVILLICIIQTTLVWLLVLNQTRFAAKFEAQEKKHTLL